MNGQALDASQIKVEGQTITLTETWLNIEEFKTKHADLLNLTYDEAVNISLEELEVMEAVDEPLWDELHRGWEEYIKIHGKRVYDDEEDE
ncbi:hypothetical protein V470_10900 [Streptococcus sp. VT 162]|nr:hypothetical protein V470_10900 [Streptococcus sp. VT 162]